MIANIVESGNEMSIWTIILTPTLTLAVLAYLSKLLMRFWFDKELESFKSSLEREVNREQVWFSSLHGEMAKRIEEIYDKLIQIDKAANSAKYAPITGSPSNPKSEEQLLAILDDANECFQKSRLYFPPKLCDDLTKFFDQVWRFGVEAKTGAKIPDREILRKENIMNSLKEQHKSILRPAMEALESTFRRLLKGEHS